ncbi:ABC transporter ATP-binding protein/permease [Ruminococcaceae bacterium OttesenSCG-928-D13]|nr:ABC transporter ATP-binding protein/permease [Ruminococcaceae bacterium OttesenSCG-928-D13]
MLKLTRYFKQYTGMLLLAIVLLFGQAMLELNLPNMMSNIVNVGIQKSGIEEVAPKALSPNAYALFTLFMDEEDFVAIQGAYTFYDTLDAGAKTKTDKTFPGAAEAGALVLTAEGEAKTEADGVMGRAGYALVSMLQKMAEDAGTELGASSETAADFDMDMLNQLLPVLAAQPESVFQEAIGTARQTPDTMVTAVSSVLNKALYQQLGADPGAMQTGYIVRTGLVMILLAVILMACAVGATFCFARFGSGVARDLRRDVFARVSAFSNAEMDSFSTSSLITRTTNDVTQVQMLATMGLRMLVFAPIMGTGGVIMALRKSPGMSWILGAAVALLLVVILVLLKFVMPKFKLMQKLLDRLNQVARENLSGIMVVRAFSNQKFQEERFEKANDAYTKNSLFVGRAMVTMMPFMMLIMNFTSLFIIWLGADQVAASAMQVGDIMAFLQYAMHVIMSFLFIAMMFVMVPRASVSAERINEVLRSEPTVKDPESPKTFGGRAKGVVAFNDVSFRYKGAGEDALAGISFTAEPGKTTAFIGATGSGKTTLVNLIPRFYDATGGSVTLDGVDVRQLTQHELRANVGYVPQKGLLFSGTIASNLRYGNENATDTELREAAEIAQATEFIDTMEDGFATAIAQGGTNVSGGQRQRLSIARALVKKPPVYIFDDSFSALDFATDAKLRAALKPYTQDATVLIVAQRVSTIMTAEQIVVLDEGAVVGIGTHRQLLENCQAYREIAESQLSKEELA